MTARRPYASRGVPHRPSTRPARASRLPFLATCAAVALLLMGGGVALAFGIGHTPSVSGARGGAAAEGPSVAAVTAPSAASGAISVPPEGDAPAAVTLPALSRQWTGVARGTDPEVELAGRLQGDLAGVDGHVAVAVKDLATGRGAVLNGDEEQAAASLYKLEVLYSVFDLGLNLSEPLTITQDALDYDTGTMELGPGETLTIAEALERMVVLSDNTSGVMLGSRVGGTRINSLMANMGLESTHYSVDRMTSSVTDMLALVESMARGRAASPGASADMIHLLLRQRVNDRLPRLLPAGVQVAHKTGNLPGVVNDVGILYGPSQTIAVAAMISDTTDETAAATAIARVAQTAYAFFANAPADPRRPTVPPPPSRSIPPVWREPRPVPTLTPTLVAPARVATETPPGASETPSRDSASLSRDSAATAATTSSPTSSSGSSTSSGSGAGSTAPTSSASTATGPAASAPTSSTFTVAAPTSTGPASPSAPIVPAAEPPMPVPGAPAAPIAPTATPTAALPMATTVSALATRPALAATPTATPPRATPTPARR